MDYGFRSPIWMLKALIVNAPRDQVDNMLTTLIDYLDNEEHSPRMTREQSWPSTSARNPSSRAT